MAEISQHAFAEKVTLITGGNTPVARAIAIQLAMYGAYVVLAHPESSEELPVIKELKSLGTLAESVDHEGFGHDDASKVVRRVRDLYERLDLLVNTSTQDRTADFKASGEEFLLDTLSKTIGASYFITLEALDLMKDRPSPRIVNVISEHDSTSGDIAKQAANGSVERFTKSLASYLPDKFQVNGIRIIEGAGSGTAKPELDPDLFRKRPTTDHDDVARAVLFLLSSEAKGLSGQILKIGRCFRQKTLLFDCLISC